MNVHVCVCLWCYFSNLLAMCMDVDGRARIAAWVCMAELCAARGDVALVQRLSHLIHFTTVGTLNNNGGSR